MNHAIARTLRTLPFLLAALAAGACGDPGAGATGEGSSTDEALNGAKAKPAALSITPTSDNFGAVAAGSSSADATFTVTNTGGATSGALTVGLSGANGYSFAIDPSPCAGATLAAGKTCVVKARFAPASGVSGTQTGTLVVTGSPGGTVTATLTGNASTPASLALNPGSGSFGTVAVGQTSAPVAFTLTNTGGVAAGPVALALSDKDFVLSNDACTGRTLAAGASCVADVSFAPTVSGALSGTLTASAGSLSASAALSGTSHPATVTLTVETLLDPNCPATYIQGTVNYSPSTDPCSLTYGTTCTRVFPYGTAVGLSLSSQEGTFDGWSGACNGTSTSCGVSMTSDEVVYVHYCGWIG